MVQSSRTSSSFLNCRAGSFGDIVSAGHNSVSQCASSRFEVRGTRQRGEFMGQRRTIAGSRILITGASQGIGRALAVAAAARGGKVLAAARSEDLLGELAGEVHEHGGILESVQADVTSAADREQLVAA